MEVWQHAYTGKEGRGGGTAARNQVGAHSDALHVQVELVGQVAQGQRPTGPQGSDVHIGDEVVVLRHHLQGEVRSEAVAAQAPPQPVHHSCAHCQLVGARALTCSHTQNISPRNRTCLLPGVAKCTSEPDQRQAT